MIEVMTHQSSSSESYSQWKDGSEFDTSFSRPYSDLDIAVIGMACNFPGAASLEQLWNILEAGKSQFRDLPKDRFPESRFERRSYSRNFQANTIEDIDTFDHKFFKIASREAAFMDPQQRLALQVAYQALESAGYFSRSAAERELDIGCYVGTCTNEYHENVACHPPSAFSLTGSIRPFIAGKVSHKFGWTGPAMIFDTACSASGTAIHQACRAIATGECKGALAGATNIFVSPDTFQDLAAGHFMSISGGSKSFDAAADGYCRGEGVAFVVLKKVSTALQDGDPILGVIASTAVGQNANETSITVPHGPSQMNLYSKALRLAGLSAQDISYVEAHGTGTPVGDPIEVASIRGVFSNSNYYNDHRKTYLGSLKSNIGHTEAASGISGLIKVLLMMQKRMIPQQALFKNLNPAITALEPDGIEIPRCNVAWTPKFKAACVNNYGASGTNAVMIVTQPPCVTTLADMVPADSYPVSITAFSPSSLASYCSNLLEFISRSDRSDALMDISYHLSRRKNLDLPYSLCATVSSLQEFQDVLKSTVARQSHTSERIHRPVVMFFGGQVGRMSDIPRAYYDSCTVFRNHLDDCDSILQALGVPSILPGIFESEPQDDLVLLHSMLFSGQYASALAWLDCGLRPARLIGHSFGQLTAFCVSGILSLDECLRLVVERARLIDKTWGNESGSMIAVEADLDKVTNLVAQHASLNLEIACHNGPRNFTVAGNTASIDTFEASLKSSSESIPCRRLQVTHAFHSALAEPLISSLLDTAEHLHFHEAKIPLEICREDSKEWSITPNLIASHIRDPVYFYQTVDRISEQLGACTWIEAGMGTGAPVLRQALGKRGSCNSIKSMRLNSASSVKPLAQLTSELWSSGLEVQFWPFHQSQRHQYKALNLPPYQFDKHHHWLDWKDLAIPVLEVQHPMPAETSILLLMQKTGDGGDFKINTKCETWQHVCSEHRVLEVLTCPMSLLLDLVSKAIGTIQNMEANETCLYNLQQLAVSRLIPAEPESELHLTVTKIDRLQSWKFSVNNASNLSHEYTSGIVSVANQSTFAEFARFRRLIDITRIEGLLTDADADSIKGKAVYRSVSDLFRFSRSGQTIREVTSRGNEAVGFLVPVSNTWSATIDSLLQIPLLCLNSLRDRQSDEIYSVTMLGQAKCNGSLTLLSKKHQSWTVYVRFFESSNQATACDIFMFDMQDERVFAVILDVTFSRMRLNSLKQTLDCVSSSLQSTVKHCSTPSKSSECDEPLTSQRSEPELSSNHLSHISTALFELLSHVADVESNMLHTDSLIMELGIDSLMAMDVTQEINKVFSVDIDIAEAVTVTTLGSLCELIARKTSDSSYNSEAGPVTPSDDVIMVQPYTRKSPSQLSNSELASDSKSLETTTHSFGRQGSVEESFHAVLKAFDAIRRDFDVIAKATGCDKFYSQVYPAQTDLVVAYIVEAFAKLGCNLCLTEEGKKISKIPHSSKNAMLINELMYALQDDGLVTHAAEDWVRTSKPAPSSPSSSEKYERLLAVYPQFAPDHKLLHVVGSNLAECLTGKANPLKLLFGTPERRKLMADQYSIAPIQSATSQQLSKFIKTCFSSRPVGRSLRILEIGGGTCGTSLYTVDAFARLNLSVEYTFSDISPSFVSAAKSKLAQYKFVNYRTLDITQDPEPDTTDYYDMIIATNVMHATPSVYKSVDNARRMLRSGGFLTLVEYTRRLYSLDVIFGQFDGWWLFEDGRNHAIMDENEWKTTLQRANFNTVDWTGGQSRESEISRIFLAF